MNKNLVFAETQKVMKATSKNRNLFNKQFNSLSRLLREMQLETGVRTITDPIFEACGFEPTGKIRPSQVLDSLCPEQFVTISVKKEEIVLPAIVSRSKMKDNDGHEILDEQGEPCWEYKMTPIREGGWTLNKLEKLLADRKSFMK